jgi:hypothetical protein
MAVTRVDGDDVLDDPTPQTAEASEIRSTRRVLRALTRATLV